jgi:hypothetical protein
MLLMDFNIEVLNTDFPNTLWDVESGGMERQAYETIANVYCW